MARSEVSATYGDVDRSADPDEAAASMDRVATYPGFVERKRRSLELLAGVGRVLDVGCGVGDDVRTLGAGAVGVARFDESLAASVGAGTFRYRMELVLTWGRRA